MSSIAILEYEVDNISGFEAQMNNYNSNEALRTAMKGYTELWMTGSRELLQTA